MGAAHTTVLRKANAAVRIEVARLDLVYGCLYQPAPDSTGNSQRENASTGPRTPQGKKRSAANASKHKVFVGRILPEELKLAAHIYEELLKDLNPQGLLQREIVHKLVLNLLQRRRIDRYNVNQIVKERAHGFEAFVEAEEQSRAELFLRQTDNRRAISADCKRLAPEACVNVLGGLRVIIQNRGLVPDEDLEVLKRVYGAEPTALGAMMQFLCGVFRYQCSGKDEKSKVECERLREQILEALESEVKFQQSRVERKFANAKIESSLNVMVPPSSIVDQIQRYCAANAREFAQLLDALERIRRVQNA